VTDEARLAPVGHPLRFTTIAHGERTTLGPLSPERLASIVERLDLAPGSRVIELGSGKGELLVRILARWPGVSAEGFDRSPWFLADARAAADAAGVLDRLSLIETDAPGPLVADREVDLAIAVGATGVLGGDQAATIGLLAGAVRHGGLVLFGDGAWIGEPSADGLAAFGMTRDELVEGPDGLAALGIGADLEPLAVEVVSHEEWDAYESAYAGAVERWASRHPDDPERDGFLARARSMAASYATWRRDAMGFAVGLFRVR
jgi:SAM-dependent methyltransferase